uniref:Mucin n=1 Tax=Rhipicephalus appendiculatus TaxID=34631 RepID=A0A131YDL2_RHIAP
MKDVILYLLLLAAFSGTTLCTLPPTPGLRLRYACPPRCYAGQPHGSTCGPNCTCRAHTENPLSLLCVYTFSRNPYNFRRPRRRSPGHY